MQAIYAAEGLDGCRRLLEKKRDEWKNNPLNVAVIGNSGVGKSSFINAIRGLSAGDEGAAAVGVTQTTMEPRSYPHPDNPMLKFWDLPGVGTDEFPRASYLNEIDVNRYDFFLLLCARRFTENDTWLCKEFQKRNKKYFFVRTMIEVDISNNEKDCPKTHNAEDVVKKIRQTTEEILRKHEGEDVPLFLIDNYKLDKFDFEKLTLKLIRNFLDLKRSSLILSLQSISVQMIQLKMAELRPRAWKMATRSATVEMIPIPGVSVVTDVGIVVGEAMFYFKQLGLDDESLQRYAKLHSADYDKMQSVIRNRLGIYALGAVTAEGMTTLVMEILARVVPLQATTAAEESARIFLPVISNFTAAPLTFVGTQIALNAVLDKFEKVAVEVMQCVMLNDDSTEKYNVEGRTVSEDAQT